MLGSISILLGIILISYNSNQVENISPIDLIIIGYMFVLLGGQMHIMDKQNKERK